MNYEITLNINIDATDEEINLIKNCFNKDINILIEKTHVQLSIDTPLVINFILGSIVSGIFYDILKISIINLLRLTIRKIIIEIHKKNKIYYFAKNDCWTRDKKNNFSHNTFENIYKEFSNDENENMFL